MSRSYLSPSILFIFLTMFFATLLFAQDPFTKSRINDIDRGLNKAVAWGDFNNDGFVDLYVSNGSSDTKLTNFFYKNNQDGTFTKITSGDIVTDEYTSGGCSWGDFDNDGDIDLYVSTNTGSLFDQNIENFLYINNGNETFTKSTTAGPPVTDKEHSAGGGWGDYNNDGYIDIFVENGWFGKEINSLYSNNGDGTFRDVTDIPLVGEEGSTFIAGFTWADYDDDGDLDLFVAGGSGPNNFLWRNDGSDTFTKIDMSQGENSDSQAASWGDYDNDGDLDLFITNYGESDTAPEANFLFRNDGGDTFTKVTDAGDIVTDQSFSTGSAWGDIDNDGDLDMFVATSAPPADWHSYLYYNDGDGTFTKNTTSVINDSTWMYGVAWADYDNDGFLDLFACRNDTNFLFTNNGINNGNTNNWIILKLVGTTSNKSGIGTIVRARATINLQEVRQMRDVSAQTGYGSHNDLRVHFGLGDATVIDELILEWPSGNVQTLTGVAVNQILTITEESGGESITVTSPNGGENWIIGSSQNITWSSSGTSGTVDLAYSTNDGTDWTDIAISENDDGTYAWTIPDAPSTNCLVRVTDSDASPSDESNAVFTISGAASITVTAPNGGEDWEVSSTHDITWNSSNTSGTVNLDYSTDNGTNWTSIAAGEADDGTYSWTIPDAPSTNCLVRVADSDGDPTDQSDASFTISQAPFITVTAPNGGEDWQVGSVHDITWTSNKTSGTVNLEYSTDNGTNWTSIAAGETDDGTYAWTIPDAPSTNCLVRVADSDGDPTDESDAVFTISQAPFITVTAPNGGEDWEVGSSQNITWNSNKTSGTVDLAYSTNDGTDWIDIATGETDDGTYAWTIPDAPSTNCLVRVADSDGAPTDQSDAVFTISQAPFITVTAPNGGEDWQVGSVHDITWTSNKTSGTVNLDYSTDNGTNWTSIAAGETDDGTYAWTIPDAPSTNCLVRVADSDGDPTDESDAVFTISSNRFDISGNTFYYQDNRPVSDATIDLNHVEGSVQVITDTNGDYLFSSNPTGAVDLTPSKEGDLRDAITGSDGLLVLQYTAFLADLTDDQKVAADVTEDGNVSNSDAQAILRYLAFYTDNIGSTGQWRFAPPDSAFTLSENFVVNFKSFLLGDATGDWAEGGEAMAKGLKSYSNIAMHLIPQNGAEQDKIVVPIYVENPDESLNTLIFSLNYDPSVLKFNSVAKTKATETFMVVSNGTVSGKVHFAMAGVKGIETAGEILYLHFDVVDPATRQQNTVLEVTRALLNDKPVLELTNSEISFDEVNSIPTDFGLSQNYPNPFNPVTGISYQLPEASDVRLSIYNVLGKEIRVLVNENKDAGNHQINWNGKDETGLNVPSGLYIMSIKAGEWTSTRKMLKIQ